MNIKYPNIILVTFSCISLVSCNVIGSDKNARIETVIKNVKISSSLRSYEQCISDGKSFDNLASTKKEEADSLYNKSAKILSDCDFLIKDNSYIITEDQRMRNAALSIQNYIKAGNLIQASLNLKNFQNTFNKDLIYKDGSSFIENIASLLRYNDPNIFSEFSLINNSNVVKSELKRINYWSKK
jgi:hypothetical protein